MKFTDRVIAVALVASLPVWIPLGPGDFAHANDKKAPEKEKPAKEPRKKKDESQGKPRKEKREDRALLKKQLKHLDKASKLLEEQDRNEKRRNEKKEKIFEKKQGNLKRIQDATTDVKKRKEAQKELEKTTEQQKAKRLLELEARKAKRAAPVEQLETEINLIKSRIKENKALPEDQKRLETLTKKFNRWKRKADKKNASDAKSTHSKNEKDDRAVAKSRAQVEIKSQKSLNDARAAYLEAELKLQKEKLNNEREYQKKQTELKLSQQQLAAQAALLAAESAARKKAKADLEAARAKDEKSSGVSVLPTSGSAPSQAASKSSAAPNEKTKPEQTVVGGLINVFAGGSSTDSSRNTNAGPGSSGGSHSGNQSESNGRDRSPSKPSGTIQNQPVGSLGGFSAGAQVPTAAQQPTLGSPSTQIPSTPLVADRQSLGRSAPQGSPNKSAPAPAPKTADQPKVIVVQQQPNGTFTTLSGTQAAKVQKDLELSKNTPVVIGSTGSSGSTSPKVELGAIPGSAPDSRAVTAPSRDRQIPTAKDQKSQQADVGQSEPGSQSPSNGAGQRNAVRPNYRNAPESRPLYVQDITPKTPALDAKKSDEPSITKEERALIATSEASPNHSNENAEDDDDRPKKRKRKLPVNEVKIEKELVFGDKPKAPTETSKPNEDAGRQPASE